MATAYTMVTNDSGTPIAYLGEATGLPTPWKAYGFAANSREFFSWEVTFNKGDQALLTKAGVFYIWDDGDWKILCEKEGSSTPETLVKLEGPGIPFTKIELKVDSDGGPSATQVPL